jgi:hypothetical protein
MALRKASEKAGENAYQSALGNLTEFTGGRLNSWAAKAAADSKQAYADKGDADVLNYIQMILSGQKAFTDDVFGYDTGFYGRDYQERQTPILNRQEDERIAIERLLAESGAEADRIRAQATAKNAATNASELAWRKEKEKENAAPNNDVVILYSDYVKAPDKNKWLNDMAPYLTQNELEWIIKQYKAQYGDIKDNSVLDELFK